METRFIDLSVKVNGVTIFVKAYHEGGVLKHTEAFCYGDITPILNDKSVEEIDKAIFPRLGDMGFKGGAK
jgi:hypothetical protein